MDGVLVVGDRADPHVAAVVDRLRSSAVVPVVLDMSTLREHRWSYLDGVFKVGSRRHGWHDVSRGWLRRLAPAGHHSGVVLGSREAAEAGARLALLAALDATDIDWLTGYWALMRAENKLVQYQAAGSLGISVPATAVVSHSSDLDDGLGDPVIVKPLGIGHFEHEDVAHAVHSQLMGADDPALEGLAEAPFLVQSHVAATEHLRVVTVMDLAWSARLAAGTLPIDWREAPTAHAGWEPTNRPQVEKQAVALAHELGLGYSSQDWVVDRTGESWFLDINPGGQWLFLPPAVGDRVSDAIAAWLSQSTS